MIRYSDQPQYKVGAAIGLSKSAMTRSVTGKRAFTGNELIRIAEYLGIPFIDLIPKDVRS